MDETKSGVNETIRQICDLMISNEEDEYGPLRPTEIAYSTAIVVLGKASLDLTQMVNQRDGLFPFPRGAVTTDEWGGLRIEWVCGDAVVHLLVPAFVDGGPQVYHEVGKDSASGRKLADWLCELITKKTTWE